MDTGAESYQRFLCGDDEGLVEIIRDYKDGLILYLCSFTENITAAEELMEDTFVKIAIKKPKFSGKSSFKTWLYAIGRNIAIDYIRKNKRLKHVPLDECFSVQNETDVEADYIKEEQRLITHHAMQKLKPEYQQVLHLVYIEGFTHDETAQIMNKNRRQVTNLNYRAKKALKIELEKEGFCYEEL